MDRENSQLIDKGVRTVRMRAASTWLCFLMVMLVLNLLLGLCRSRRTSSYAEDRRIIQDVSGQPLYRGEPLDYWILTADCDPEARLALHALESVAVPLLVKRFKNSPRSMEHAVALMRLGPVARSAVPELITLLQQEDGITSSPTRYLAVSILGHIGPEAAEAVPTLLTMLETGKRSYARAVIHTLGCIGVKAEMAAPALRQVLDSADDLDRALAAEALWRIQKRWEPILPTLIWSSQRGNMAAASIAQTLLVEIQQVRSLKVAAQTHTTPLL